MRLENRSISRTPNLTSVLTADGRYSTVGISTANEMPNLRPVTTTVQSMALTHIPDGTNIRASSDANCRIQFPHLLQSLTHHHYIMVSGTSSKCGIKDPTRHSRHNPRQDVGSKGVDRQYYGQYSEHTIRYYEASMVGVIPDKNTAPEYTTKHCLLHTNVFVHNEYKTTTNNCDDGCRYSHGEKEIKRVI